MNVSLFNETAAANGEMQKRDFKIEAINNPDSLQQQMLRSWLGE